MLGRLVLSRSLGCALSVVVGLLVGACREREGVKPIASNWVAPAPSRPAELALTLVAPRPAETWARLRELAGPLALALPSGPELTLASVLGLPPLSAASFDLSVPLVAGMAVARDGAPGNPVFAIQLRSGEEFVAALTTGSTATHSVEREAEIAILAPRSPGAAPPTLAVLDDRLVIGERRWLAVLAPYLVRSLARKPAGSEPVLIHAPADALRSAVVPALRARWAAARRSLEQSELLARRAHGRPADVAEPVAVLRGADAAVGSFLAALESARELRAVFTPESERALLDVELLADTPGAAMELAKGLGSAPTDAMFSLPPGTALGLLLARAPTPSPTRWSEALHDVFGDRLTAADRAAFDAVASGLESARGTTQSFGALAQGGLVWTGDVSDRDQMKRALRAAVELLRRRGFAEPLAALVGAPRVGPVLPLAGGAERVAVGFLPSAEQRRRGAAARKLEIAWQVDQRRFALVIASEPRALLAGLASEAPANALPGAELLATPQAAVALRADLVLFGLGSAPASLLLEAALTRRDDGAALRLAASAAAVRALVAKGVF